MKLVLCLSCHDVYKLASVTRHCKCGNTSGHYLEDGLNAVVSDNDDTCVLGFHNGELATAINRQRTFGDQADGMGRRFAAFVIPDKAPTVKRVRDIPKQMFAVIDITESGAGRASGTLGAPAGVEAGRYALVPEPIAKFVPDTQMPQYTAATL